MESQENDRESEVRETAGTAEEPVAGEASATQQRPGWRVVFRQALEKARSAQQPGASRRELGKDKSRSLLLLAGAGVAVLLLFLGVFSSPKKVKGPGDGRRPGTPDLGRRVVPGQENVEPGKSTTPLLSADVSDAQNLGSNEVTPEDIHRTARPGSSPTAAQAGPSKPGTSPPQYALNNVDFSDPALRQQPGYGVGPGYQNPPLPPTSGESNDLRKPSLVFVRAADASATASVRTAVLEEQGQVDEILPAGTRLVARLETAVSTAVKEPVVAVIEYNYERDGEIVIPAGAKAVGDLRQADSSGYVDIRFHTLELPEGMREKLDGVAMDLRFGPLKGTVAGKKTGTKFLVSALTGVGTAAAYLVGNTGSSGFYGPISESALLRERIANNIGMAGDQQLNELGFNQHIVVTVAGNTRFYIVLANGTLEKDVAGGAWPGTIAPTPTQNTGIPSLEELRQLMQLRQELSTMYPQASTLANSAQAPQQ
jgi:hypothetical protein